MLSRSAFTDRYPGAFLLALGFLSVDEIRRGKRASGAAGREIDETATFTFGKRLRHDKADSHPLAGCTFYLRPTETMAGVVLGRSPGCDITIPETGVSEHHCRIELTGRGVVVIDTDSTNGTTINLGRLVAQRPQLLADEDILSVGRYSFQMLSSQTFHAEMQLIAAL